MWFSLIIGGLSLLFIHRKAKAYERYADSLRRRTTGEEGDGHG